ncbi:MAG TPA: helix-turn-helix transcriptional regulator [Burkholderiales bacterium]|nr:helix-turn-helix transcriptional regulator [Burkholderiales bacterium]
MDITANESTTAFPESPVEGENPRAIVPRSTVYPRGHRITPHWHTRAQFVFATRGTITVRTQRRAWIVPPSRALWLPAHTVHEVQTYGEVEMRSLYVKTADAEGMPETCVVLEVTPLLRELVVRAAALPVEYDEAGDDGLLMQLLMAEMRRVPRCALDLPLAESIDLRGLCEQILDELAAGRPRAGSATAVAAGGVLNVSSKTLYRRFLRETGISFARWKQQARLLEAIRKLADGVSVTTVAMDLGYDSASAFSTMFRRSLGVSPRVFLSERK